MNCSRGLLRTRVPVVRIRSQGAPMESLCVTPLHFAEMFYEIASKKRVCPLHSHRLLCPVGTLFLIYANHVIANPVLLVFTSAIGAQQNTQEPSAAIETLRKAAQ